MRICKFSTDILLETVLSGSCHIKVLIRSVGSESPLAEPETAYPNLQCQAHPRSGELGDNGNWARVRMDTYHATMSVAANVALQGPAPHGESVRRLRKGIACKGDTGPARQPQY